MNKKTLEEILSTKRKASRRRYDEIKSDPELSRLRKEKDKENYTKKKKNMQVLGIKQKSEIEQQKQREKWRQNSRAYYLRKKKQKQVQHVNVNENIDGDEPLIDVVADKMDPLEPSCSKELHRVPNERKQKVTILSDVKVNYDLKKLFGSGTTKGNWEYNCSSLNISKDFKELGN